MGVQAQIDSYIADQPSPKREEMQALHRLIVETSPGCKLWFLDGRNGANKVVSNPNIGYGSLTMTYAGGDTREFYRVGLSANTTGLSIYLMGMGDRTYLSDTFGKALGKAKVTGYCVKFKTIRDIDLGVLTDMIATCLHRETARSV